MKNVMIAAVAFCAAFASCQGAKNMKSYTTADSISYAIGVDLVNQFQLRSFQDSVLIGEILAAAVRDVFNDKAQMTPEQATAFLNEYFNVRKPAIDATKSQSWLNEVKAGNPNIQTTASGLMYEIINAGDPAVRATNDADQVVASYRGTLSDGTEFDKNDSIPFTLNGVIRGWTEGLKLIGKGGEINLWIPSELGYGAQGGGPIPPNSALKFEIKLLDVIPAVPAE